MSQALDNIRPLGDRVLIKKLDPETTSKGGIIIPAPAEDRELAWRAEIIAVGPGRVLENGKLVEPRVKKGETIVVGKYMGTNIKIDGVDYYVVREDDLLGVIED